MSMEQRLADLIEPELRHLGYALVRVHYGGGKRPALQVMAERPDGTLTIDDCVTISRALSDMLDAADPIAEEYRLEVSSPGIDRPLTRPFDFDTWAGHDARLELSEPLDGRKRLKGVLRGREADGALVRLEVGESEIKVPLSSIDSARLVLTDALIAASLKGQRPGPHAATEALADGQLVDDTPTGSDVHKSWSGAGRATRAGAK